jgi:hypothetical protein
MFGIFDRNGIRHNLTGVVHRYQSDRRRNTLLCQFPNPTQMGLRRKEEKSLSFVLKGISDEK